MNSAKQLKETLAQIFPREADRRYWLCEPNKLLCNNTPQRLVNQGHTDYILEALQLQLGNIIGCFPTKPSAGFTMLRQIELTLQAHRGAPNKNANPHCTLCSGKGIRHDNENGDSYYCVCVYSEAPVWITP